MNKSANISNNSTKASTATEVYKTWAYSQQRAKSVVNLLKVAAPDLVLDRTVMDADPWLLNVQNGTIDLKTGKLLPHQAHHFMTKVCPIEFDPSAKCGLFLAFLDRIFNGDQDLIQFVQKALGYSLTGSVAEQAFFLLHGTGANGKSTFVETVAAVLGPYAQAAAPGLLMARKHESHPTELADLFGARFVVCAEVRADARWEEERVKQLTGGDTIKARKMREDFWEFRPSHKLWILVNHRPSTADSTEGFWRRVVMIPFEVTIPKAERDPKLPEKLRTELPGILAWAVEGCLLWQQEGLNPPESVRAATATYRNESDPLQAFLEERCLLGPGRSTRSTDLYQAYHSWALERGEEPGSQKAFSGRLKSLGYKDKRSNVVWFLGLSLRPMVDRSYEDGTETASRDEPS